MTAAIRCRALAALAALASLAAPAALGSGCGSEAPVNAETEARERFIHDLAEREGVGDVWYVMSRTDVVFEDGWSLAQMVDPGPGVPWTEVERPIASVRAVAARWLGPSAHLRLRSRTGRDMHLRMWGAINRNLLLTRPRVTATFDGVEISSRVVGDDGTFTIEAVIPAAWLHGWSDVYVTLSSVGEPWREASSLRVARVEGVWWEPVP